MATKNDHGTQRISKLTISTTNQKKAKVVRKYGLGKSTLGCRYRKELNIY